jgi:DNA-binding NarL/FixJ family response regulator
MMHNDAEHAAGEGRNVPPKRTGSVRRKGSSGANPVTSAPLPLGRRTASPVTYAPPPLGRRTANPVKYAPLPLAALPTDAASTAGAPAKRRGRPAPSPPRVEPGPTITLALIGGPRLLREAAAGLLAAQDDLDVTGTFQSVAEYLDADRKSPPAVLLLDCDGGEPGDARSALEMLSAARVESRIVMLCREIGEEVVRGAIAHRVSGVLLKCYSTEDVRAALRYTATGRTVLPAGWQRAADPHTGGNGRLSPRHRQILGLIAEGRRNAEIARDLNLSPNTIKFHVRALYARMGVRNRVEAANRYAQMTSEDT